jgi:hypothetical protein
MENTMDKVEKAAIVAALGAYALALIFVSLPGCDQKRDTYPGIPYYLPDGTSFTAQEFKYDMPRTFDSGSCIARGDTLLLRRPQMIWYCKENWGINSYRITELEPDRK